MSPLLTRQVADTLRAARCAGQSTVECSLDLQRSTVRVELGDDAWLWQGNRFAYPQNLKERTIYYWHAGQFQPAARYAQSLVKLVPTAWGAPTFEIDGIKMLPTASTSPYTDAQRKVDLIKPRGKRILDTCGGLGYFAACCVQRGARAVASFEKNPDVIWLRDLNPWSPRTDTVLNLRCGDIAHEITSVASCSVDAVLHDPPRFGIAGELYSQAFYSELARVVKRRGSLFHYTGSPNRSSGRDLAAEVMRRLSAVGFDPAREGDGVLARRS